MTDIPDDLALHPRYTTDIYGHAEAERLLLADFNRDKLPGAYLFCGPKGIGKASMAYRFSRFLFATPPPGSDSGGLFGEVLPPIRPASLAVDAEHPAARRVASGAHMNLLLIERSVDEKSKKLRNEIVVEDVRRIHNFLSKSAAEESWRIVLVDTADELNNNAANAMLKWLEEPPERALFILIASNPGKLLPTIRSRCRSVAFQPPGKEEFGRILAARHAVDAEEAESLYFLSGGAPGRALTLHESGMSEIFAELMGLFAAQASPQRLEQFAEQLSGTRRKDRPFHEVAAMLLAVLAGIIRAHAGASLFAPEGKQPVFAALAAKKPLDYWLDLWEKCAPLLADVERIHLDPRMAVSGVLLAYAGKESTVHYLKGAP